MKINKLELVTVVVDDYDEAITFYTDVLGFELRADNAMGDTDSRWVVVGVPGQPQVSIVLHKPYGGQKRGVRLDHNLSWIFYTEDCHHTYNTLCAKGVKFLEAPKQYDWGTQALFEDLYGNQFVLLQPTPAAA